MAKKILLDLIRLRSFMVENPSASIPECYFQDSVAAKGLKSLRELALFRFACRKCEDAPCVSVCPAEALEKDGEGIITRHTNLCISCKSCVTICPFGTMMTDFFRHHRNKELYFDLDDGSELDLFIKACPPGVVSATETGEMPSENIHKLNERVFVREYLYTTEKP